MRVTPARLLVIAVVFAASLTLDVRVTSTEPAARGAGDSVLAVTLTSPARARRRKRRRTGFFRRIKNAFKKVGSAIKRGVGRVAGAIKRGVKRGWRAVKRTFKRVGSALKRSVSRGASAIKRGFKRIGSTLKRGWKRLIAKIRGRAKKVGRWLKRNIRPGWWLGKLLGRCRRGRKVKVDYSRWELTFQDEFNGSDGSACFTKAPQCQPQPYWGPQDCPRETWAKLADLDKCKWSVFHYKNYMAQAVNNFSAKDVTVKDGMLVLTSRARPPSAVRADAPACATAKEWTASCAFSAGGVEGRPLSGVPGFTQRYGRWEIRAKLPDGTGTWPAHWLMPQGGTGGWPADGEIDIMEMWGPNTNKVAFTLHWKGKGTHQQLGEGCKISKRNDFTRGFHTFAIEWEPSEIRWYVDDYHVYTLRAGKKNGHRSPAPIPQLPFYWILNTSITQMKEKPNPQGYGVHHHYIDYVRVYRRKGKS